MAVSESPSSLRDTSAMIAMPGGKSIPQSLEVPPHPEVQQLVAVEAVRRPQVDRQVQAELDGGLEQHEAGGEGGP